MSIMAHLNEQSNKITLDKHRPLKRLVYLPTLRCNYRCKMCPQVSLDTNTKDEFGLLKMIATISKSNILKSMDSITLSGGEIFLLDDIVDFILELEKLGIKSYITSNGYFTEKIVKLIDSLESKDSVSFSVSIDGFAETHNMIRGCKNGFEKSLETIKLLKERGIEISVNTVMQVANNDELERFHEFINQLGIRHNCIPLLSNENINNSFSDDEIKYMLPYVTTPYDLKYVLSKGSFRISNCHAGINSCFIDPFGQVFVCVGGLRISDKYSIGSLKIDNFDEIWSSHKLVEVYSKVVRLCPGCYEGCEITREYVENGLSVNLTKSEVQPIKYLLSNEYRLENDYVISGWHDLEQGFRWMAKKESKVFMCQASNESSMLMFAYINNLPGYAIRLNVLIDGNSIGEIFCNHGYHELSFPIDFDLEEDIVEVSFYVDHLWRPSEVMGTEDDRQLGVAIAFLKLL